VNYYEHHIGDYDEATSHLTACEDGIYSRMIRKYYAKEKPLAADVAELKRLMRCKSAMERAAVDKILAEFFRLEEDGWHQNTCDEVIAAYQAGEPEREARKANEDTRVKRHREERAKLFQQLTAAGQHAKWNIPIAELRALVAALPATGSVTPPATAPVTPATAPQTPTPTSQPPVKEKGGRKRTASFDASAIETPPWLDNALWKRWCRDRKARGKAITEDGATGQLKRLELYRDEGIHTPEAVLEHAITSGNQGLFPPPVTKGALQVAKSFRGKDIAAKEKRAEAMTGGIFKAEDQTAPLGEIVEMEQKHARIASR
jgi:uncharacterized protein YdaU (DUF1376 family)